MSVGAAIIFFVLFWINGLLWWTLFQVVTDQAKGDS